MVKHFIFFLLVFCSTNIYAQMPTHNPVSTSPPYGAAFEIVQNAIAMKDTFLLNRYTGQTWQLVKSTKRYKWQTIFKESHIDDIKVKDLKEPVYQISISGISSKGTYLINTVTGATWVLFEDPSEGLFWGAIPAAK